MATSAMTAASPDSTDKVPCHRYMFRSRRVDRFTDLALARLWIGDAVGSRQRGRQPSDSRGTLAVGLKSKKAGASHGVVLLVARVACLHAAFDENRDRRFQVSRLGATGTATLRLLEAYVELGNGVPAGSRGWSGHVRPLWSRPPLRDERAVSSGELCMCAGRLTRTLKFCGRSVRLRRVPCPASTRDSARVTSSECPDRPQKFGSTYYHPRGFRAHVP